MPRLSRVFWLFEILVDIVAFLLANVAFIIVQVLVFIFIFSTTLIILTLVAKWLF